MRGSRKPTAKRSPRRKKHGKHVGLGGIYDEALVTKFVEKGVRFILGGADLGFMMAAASARSAFLRGLEDG